MKACIFIKNSLITNMSEHPATNIFLRNEINISILDSFFLVILIKYH